MSSARLLLASVSLALAACGSPAGSERLDDEAAALGATRRALTQDPQLARLKSAASPAALARAKAASGVVRQGMDRVSTDALFGLAQGAVRAGYGRKASLVATETVDALALLTLVQVIDDLRDERDALAEMGEMQQLRMQMIMDRMTKADTAASNMLEKFSEIASQIIGNMK